VKYNQKGEEMNIDQQKQQERERLKAKILTYAFGIKEFGEDENYVLDKVIEIKEIMNSPKVIQNIQEALKTMVSTTLLYIRMVLLIQGNEKVTGELFSPENLLYVETKYRRLSEDIIEFYLAQAGVKFTPFETIRKKEEGKI
jgi:hypothetical protein